MKELITLKNINSLTEKQLETLIEVYAEAFAKDENWNEYLKCTNKFNRGICEKPYSEEEALLFLQKNNEEIEKRKTAKITKKNNETLYECIQCNAPLSFDFYWKDGTAKKHLEKSIKTKGFVGIASLIDDVVIGGSWGFRIPETNNDTVLYAEVRELFKQKKLDPDKIFYGCENFILPHFQNKGIGTIQAVARLKEAEKTGYESATMRTTNEYSAKIFMSAFGKENITQIFSDPDPRKKERKWYYAEMRHLK